VTGPHPDAKNTFEQPDLVTCRPLHGITVQDGRAQVVLPPLSVAAVSFKTGL